MEQRDKLFAKVDDMPIEELEKIIVDSARKAGILQTNTDSNRRGGRGMKVCERCTANNNCAWQNHKNTICRDAPAFPMTNYDLLISKTPEELAEFLTSNHFVDGLWCLRWLNSPVEKGEVDNR